MYISLMQAYTIEGLKKDGIGFVELSSAIEQNTTESLPVKMDLQPLITLWNEDISKLDLAFKGDYKITFVTINGLKNLLSMKLGIDASRYRLEENGIFDLEVSEVIERQISDFISANWTIKRKGHKISIFVAGKIR